jgi:hypothetical protein
MTPTNENESSNMIHRRFKSSFNESFQVSELTKLFIEDIKSYKKDLKKKGFDNDFINYCISHKGLISKFHTAKNIEFYCKFEIAFSKSIKYIKNNVFPSAVGGSVYITSFDTESNITLVKKTRREWRDRLEKFPDILKYWFIKVYDDKYPKLD